MKLVGLLLQQNANVFESDANANTPLHLAAQGMTEAHAQSNQPATQTLQQLPFLSLSCARALAWTVCKRLLEEAKSLKDVRNVRRRNAFDFAVMLKNDKVMRALKPNPSDIDLEPHLEKFLDMSDEQDGAGPEELAKETWRASGVTTLMLACRFAKMGSGFLNEGLGPENDGLIKYLFQKNVDPSVQTSKGCCALSIAARATPASRPTHVIVIARIQPYPYMSATSRHTGGGGPPSLCGAAPRLHPKVLP